MSQNRTYELMGWDPRTDGLVDIIDITGSIKPDELGRIFSLSPENIVHGGDRHIDAKIANDLMKAINGISLRSDLDWTLGISAPRPSRQSLPSLTLP